MLVLLGASASGKTELAKILIEKHGFEKMVTCTSRKMRPGEIEGKDYFFFTKEEFEGKIKANAFLEYVVYNNNYYGSLLKEAKDNKVIILEPNGANTLFEKLKNKITIFYINASKTLRIERMIERGDSEEVIKKRISGDDDYFSFDKFSHIDYVILNENKSLEVVADEILNLYYK